MRRDTGKYSGENVSPLKTMIAVLGWYFAFVVCLAQWLNVGALSTPETWGLVALTLASGTAVTVITRKAIRKLKQEW
jgi:hypothetical protein